MSFILSEGAEVNQKDVKGLTPMHLAVKTSEEIKTTRSIRALLLKGADASIPNEDGELAVKMLQDFDTTYPGMQEFVDEIRELLSIEDDDSLIGRLNPFRDASALL
eukprot:CAMPEP_0170502440 /NCGR_PEP_ID=MMETSP0208-20121228/41502_1 /TAXON_ID=197538 /ORGANISM="Strombidium inclinatum, Strain S3" /LENGTH=105 /DNA_ID=CAMNT_0010781519 /DNA_START=889 /DNA_END=1207 /DNA_ORIENTATION=-